LLVLFIFIKKNEPTLPGNPGLCGRVSQGGGTFREKMMKKWEVDQ
jgi:hypothetical protein